MSLLSPILVVSGFGLVAVACYMAAQKDQGLTALVLVVGAGLLAMGVAL